MLAFFLINKRIMAKRLTDYRERAKITLIIRIIKYKSLRIYIYHNTNKARG